MFKFDAGGLVDITKDLDALQKEMPTIMAKTLTFTAERVQAAEKEEIRRTIDRPTPMTLNSLRKTTATAKKLEAQVWFKDPAWTLSKSGSSQHWMVPQVEGGGRPNKRSELALQRAGILPRGMYIVPGRGVKLDRYGNIPSALIIQILSALQALSEVGFMANRTERSRSRNKRSREFFATNGKGDGPNPLHAGVWEKLRDGRVSPILIFVKAPHYSPRMPFYEVARKVTDANIERIFAERLASAARRLR